MKFTSNVAQRYFVGTSNRQVTFTSTVISNSVQFNRKRCIHNLMSDSQISILWQ